MKNIEKFFKNSSRRCWNGKGTTILNFSFGLYLPSKCPFWCAVPIDFPVGTTLGKLSIIHLQTSKEKD
jgi:hypothetical protein